MKRPVERWTGRGLALRGLTLAALGLGAGFMFGISPPAVAGSQHSMLAKPGAIPQSASSPFLLPVRHEDKAHATPGDVKRHYQSQGQEPPKDYREKFEKKRRYRYKNKYYKNHNKQYRYDNRYYDDYDYYYRCEYINYSCANAWGYGSPPYYSCMAYNRCY